MLTEPAQDNLMDNDQEMTGTDEGNGMHEGDEKDEAYWSNDEDGLEEEDEPEATDEVNALAKQTAELHMDGSDKAGALDDKNDLERHWKSYAEDNTSYVPMGFETISNGAMRLDH